MERRKRVEKIEGDSVRKDQLCWQKVGGGSLRIVIDGKERIIKSGQKFFAKDSEVPVAFRDTIDCISDEAQIEELRKTDPSTKVKKTILTVVIDNDAEETKSSQEQIKDLEDIDFEDDYDVKNLRDSLKENGYDEISEIETEKLKESIVDHLKSQFIYKIVDINGKKVNEEPLSLEEAEKLISILE